MKSERISEEEEAKKKARREKLLDPNRLKVLSENASDFPDQMKSDETDVVNEDDQNISKVAEIFKTVAQSQDFQKRSILYWIRRVVIVTILFLFSVTISLNPERFYLTDKLFIKLLMFSFFISTLLVVVYSSSFGIKFSFYEMIGSNWVTKLLIGLFHIPQYVVIFVDFVITFYISLSILIFSLTSVTAYQTYIQSNLTVFNISIIVSVVIGILSIIFMIKQNKNKNNKIELIVEYIFYKLTLIPVSAEVIQMLKKDKSSVTCQTDGRAVEFEVLLEEISNMKEYFGDDIKQFTQNNKNIIYNKLEEDERFKVFEKDVEKEGEERGKMGKTS